MMPPVSHLLSLGARGPTLRKVKPEKWRAKMPEGCTEVWLSMAFMVQVYDDGHGYERLTVHRTSFGSDGRFRDGITWDRLQALKAECGRGDRWAVEVYPADGSVVNDANMRHLWVMPEAPSFAWVAGP